MVLVSKLKAATASAVALAGIALGVGLAVVPTAAGQSAPADPSAKQPLAAAVRPLDDAAFLRRACVDLRGTPPTDLEQGLFRLDPDPKKRVKVVEWLLSDEPVKAADLTTNVAPALTSSTITGTTLGNLTSLSGGSTTLNAGSLTLSGTSSLTPLGLTTIANNTLLGSTLASPLGGATFSTGYQNLVPSTGATVVTANAPAVQKTAKVADSPEDPQRAKLKQEIANLKAKIEAFERLREKQAAAEKERKDLAESIAQKKAELDRLAARLKMAEVEKDKPAEKKPLGEPLQTRETAAALLKLAAAQEHSNKVLAEAVQEKLAKLREEKLVQEKVQAAKDKQSTADEYKKAVTAEFTRRADTDAAFLRRVVKEAYGVAPTALELKYFAEDQDPKKREKLVELVLKDPAVAKKLGPEAKAKLLADPAAKPKATVEYVPMTRTVPYTTPEGTRQRLETYYVARSRTADPLGKLLDQVLDGKRTDEQIADAVCLATVGRFPTESEQKMMLAAVAGTTDRKAGWKKVIGTLASTAEAQAHADSLKKK